MNPPASKKKKETTLKTLYFQPISGTIFRPSPMRLDAKQRAGRQESEKLEDIGITYQKTNCINISS